MKEFNLEAALNGEPVELRDGRKAFIFKNIMDTSVLGYKPDYPLIGMVQDNSMVHTWTLDGRILMSNDCSNGDIVGMWEEPKNSIEDLPKPFKPKKGEIYYYIHPHETNFYLDVYETTFNDCRFDEILSDTGNCFRTKEDAQKWLDFMKSMME